MLKGKFTDHGGVKILSLKIHSHGLTIFKKVDASGLTLYISRIVYISAC